MSIWRKASRTKFTTIPNEFIRNKNLSLEARALLVVLLSYPDNWEFNMPWMRANVLGTSDFITRRMLNELIAAGYIVRRPHREPDGTWRGHDYDIYEEPHEGHEKVENS
jgi:hypothetical protein